MDKYMAPLKNPEIRLFPPPNLLSAHSPSELATLKSWWFTVRGASTFRACSSAVCECAMRWSSLPSPAPRNP